jgi:hypothetical protein
MCESVLLTLTVHIYDWEWAPRQTVAVGNQIRSVMGMLIGRRCESTMCSAKAGYKDVFPVCPPAVPSWMTGWDGKESRNGYSCYLPHC